MTVAGGAATALGLQYQYLRTLEEALALLRAGEMDLVITTEDPAGDAVDFSVADAPGRVRRLVQVKGTGAGSTPLTPAEAMSVFRDLVDHDADEYLIVTNRPVGRSLADAASILRGAGTLSDVEAVGRLRTALSRAPAAVEILDNLDPGRWARIRRCRLHHDERSAGLLHEGVRESILDLRRNSRIGTGVDSSSVLLNHLIADLLERSASTNRRRLSIAEFRDLVLADSLVLADVLGRFDWGRPVGQLPPAPSTRRAQLDDLAEALPGIMWSRTPRRVAITGLSGIGKSSVAALFAHEAAPRYDWIIWLNAESSSSLRQTMELVVGATAASSTDAVLQQQLRDHFAASSATWLLVVDNAPDDHVVHPWLPPTGRVDVVATSTNDNGWTSWSHLRMGPMRPGESASLVRDRLDLGGADLVEADEERLRSLCAALEHWPLAIELACAHLASSGRGLQMADDYLEQLTSHIIDDPGLRPAGYESHPTLVAAVLHALQSLVSTGSQPARLAFLALAAMSFLPARSVPTDLAGRAGHRLDSWLPPRAGEAGSELSEVAIDRFVRELGRVSLVTRQVSSGPLPVDDTLTTNEIVLDIVRRAVDPRLAMGALLADLELVDADFQFHLDADDHRSVRRILPAAHTVLAHARTRVLLPEVATLMGNLSVFYSRVEDYEPARTLLLDELDFLEQLGVPTTTLIHLKIHLALAMCEHRLDTGLTAFVDAARSVVDTLRALATAGDVPADGLVSVPSFHHLLRATWSRRPDESALRDLLADLEELLVTLEVDAPTGLGEHNLAGAHLAEGDGRAAVEVLERALAHDDLRVSVRFDLMASLIEAYVNADRPSDASAQLAATRRALADAGLSTRTCTTSVLNAGISAAILAHCNSAPPDLLAFAREADDALTPEDVVTEADRYRRALLHLSIRAFEDPLPSLHDASSLITDMRPAMSLSADPDHRLSDLERSAVRVVQLRSEADGAVFVVADAVGHGHMNGGAGGAEVPVVMVLLAAHHVALVSASLPSLGGSVGWEQHIDGTAFFVGPSVDGAHALVWVPAWPGSMGLFPEPPGDRELNYPTAGMRSALAGDGVLLVMQGPELLLPPVRLVERKV